MLLFVGRIVGEKVGAQNMHTQNFKSLRPNRAKKTKICTDCWKRR